MWVSKHIIIEKSNLCFCQLSITKFRFLMRNRNCFSNISLSVVTILFYLQHRSQLYMLLQTCFVLHYSISQILISLQEIWEKRKMAHYSLLKQIMTGTKWIISKTKEIICTKSKENVWHVYISGVTVFFKVSILI